MGISRLYYKFSPTDRLNLTFGSTLSLTDYIDGNSYINPSFLNFSTLALVQNYILFSVQGLGAGGAVEWNPSESVKVKAAYVAASADKPNSDDSFTPGIFPIGYILYPDGESEGGLFGDPYQGAVELEFTHVDPFTIRFQYTGGEILSERFDVAGANFEWAISEQIAVFGRYGYGSYNNAATTIQSLAISTLVTGWRELLSPIYLYLVQLVGLLSVNLLLLMKLVMPLRLISKHFIIFQ